uniref:Bardet-Biedl syndrome 4 n=1 Tax=Parascaris univalens TaxID=6257 RepID=A0A915CGU7_PARUN
MTSRNLVSALKPKHMAANPRENMENADGAASIGDMYAGTTSVQLHKESNVESTSVTTHDDAFMEKKPKKSVIADPKKKTPGLTTFDRRNFLLYQYYIQRDFSSCKALIKEMLDESKGMNEYAAYVRGKIALMEGNLRESLEWLEKALDLNPRSAKYLCEIGRVHFLLGNHEKASEILMNAINMDPNNPKAYYWRAMALYHIDHTSESVKKAQQCLVSAPNAAKSAEILTFLAKLCAQQDEIIPAIEAYKKALELEPENLDVLTNVGLLYLRTHSEDQAFSILGKALSYDPTHAPSILAAGAIIQANGDYDVALSKYRIAADKCDYNGPLWNNIGMCFFGKGKYVAAISCLKKANYLCPLDWKICFNLGLVHNAMQQYASAYHFISSAVSLNRRSSMAFM